MIPVMLTVAAKATVTPPVTMKATVTAEAAWRRGR
jgi:hypothetical protein